MGRPRTFSIAAIVCLAVSSFHVSGAATKATCAGFRLVPGVGPTCPGPNGLLEVFSADGSSLGFTHGPNDAAVGPQTVRAISATPSDPLCVTGASGTFYIEFIYARAVDDADGYSANVAAVRDLVRTINGVVAEAAVATGDRARLRVLCSGTTITVRNEVLPTSKGSANFSTILTDLRNKGYDDPRVHYAVYYDDPGACSCGGQGLLYDDERPSALNLNNGNSTVPLFAVNYGRMDPRIMLHEVGHTLGAVQLRSPHNTGARHCYDGSDIMCYNDGGSRGSLYSTKYCSAEVFDCGKDDYFNAHPAPGSYLATSWNLASRVNRFLDFPEPLLQYLVCPATGGARHVTTCSITGQGANDVAFNLFWGDGGSGRFPSSGFVKPGTAVAASHTYTSAGTYTVTATPIDSTGQSGQSVTDTIKIVVDDTAPTMTVLDPIEASVYSTCATKGAGATTITWIKTGCVRVNASDSGSGVQSVSIYFNNSHAGTIYNAPYTFQPPISSVATFVTLRVEARDHAGNVAKKSFTVHFI